MLERLKVLVLVLSSTRTAIVAVCALAVSCTVVHEKDLIRFSVEETRITQSVTIFPERAILGTRNLMGFAVLDDELIATADFTTDHSLDVIDIVSGEVRQGLCKRGRGPGEFLDICPLFSIAGESVIVYDARRGIIAEVSIKTDPGTVIRQVKAESRDGKTNPIIMSTYKVGQKDVIAYNSIQGSPELVGIENPYYAMYDWESGAEKREFNLFDAAPIKDYPDYVRMIAFELRDCINSQNTTICFVMNSMPIYGFIDIQSGAVRGFRLKGEPAFSANESKLFFTGICAQDESIYAIYFGKDEKLFAPETGKTVLYKLDWNGHLLNRYELDGLYRSCYATKDKLYLSRIENDLQTALYQIDIKQL